MCNVEKIMFNNKYYGKKTGLELTVEDIQSLMQQLSIKFIYKNYKGVIAERHVVPKNIFYGGSDYHSGQGDKLFLSAFDLEKETTRHFLIEDIIEIVYETK